MTLATKIKKMLLPHRLVLLLIIALGVGLRLWLALDIQTPGHGDSAFYYTVAKNLVLGRGLVVDYVWHYLNGFPDIPHYSSDFWHPLASFFMAAPMALFGISVFNALLASITAGAIISFIAYHAGKHLLQSSTAGIMAAVLTFFAQVQIYMSLTTEANIFFGVFGMLALLFLIYAQQRPGHFLLAAVTSGILHLIRQDGILMLAAILGCIALSSSINLKTKLRLGLTALLIHTLVLSPLLLRNLAEFGAPFPPGPSTTMFLTQYEDFYRVGILRSAGGYFYEMGGIPGILADKQDSLIDNISLLAGFITYPIAWLLLLSVADLALIRRDMHKLKQLLPVFLYSAGVFFFYVVIASYSRGSLMKSLSFLLPFYYVILIDSLQTRLKKRLPVYLVIAALAIFSGIKGADYVRWSSGIYNVVYVEFRDIQQIILTDAQNKGADAAQVTVMIRDPWEFTEATGLKSIMIPNNDRETILATAARYNARYLVLPAPRPALDPLMRGETLPPFELLWKQDTQDGWMLFRINADVSP